MPRYYLYGNLELTKYWVQSRVGPEEAVAVEGDEQTQTEGEGAHVRQQFRQDLVLEPRLRRLVVKGEN